MTILLSTTVLQQVEHIAQQRVEYNCQLQRVQHERKFQPTKEAEYHQQ